MKKTKFSSYFLFLTIATFLTIFTLIVQTGYDNLIKATQTAKNSGLTRTVDPHLDVGVLDQISSHPDLSPSP